MSQSYIKCLQCGTVNLNSDYCNSCGAIINITLKRRLESEKKIQKKIEEEKIKKPSRIDEFLKRGTEHQNSAVRMLFQAIYSIWVFLAMVVGGLIASVIAAAAG